jgi:hypothetical protein
MAMLLGRALTALEVVHHKDNNGFNNAAGNLVLFPNEAEHKEHHRRQRAFEASGNASFMKCRYCGEYENPLNLQQSKGRYSAWHKECAALSYLRKKHVDGNK